MKAKILVIGLLAACFAVPQVYASPKNKNKNTKTGKAEKTAVVADTLTLLGFNDFHGSFIEQNGIPGAARLVAQVKQLRAQNADVIVLSGGDNYSGGYFPRLTEGEPFSDVLTGMGVDYSTIGNHEFDWGVASLVENMKWGSTRYLAANIFLREEPDTRPVWAHPYAIRTVRLKNGNTLKVAFIGLATPETKVSAMPEIVKDLNFNNPVDVARKVRASLQDSADLYILLTHIGTYMQNGEVMFENEDEDLTLVEGIDGIFTGHSHKEVCGIKNGKPVLQARNYGRKLSCLRYEVATDAKNRVSVRLLDYKLTDVDTEEKDPMLESVLKDFLSNPKFGFNDVICENTVALDPDNLENGTGFNRLGSLITQSYSDCYRSLTGAGDKEIVIGVCNAGTIRTLMPEGEVTRLQAGNILPFGGVLNAFKFSGTDLMKLLQYGIDCKMGWLQYHDMKIEINDGKVHRAWYIGGNKPVLIEPAGTYTVVTEHFLSSGGDGYDRNLFTRIVDSFESVPAEKRNPTDVFINYLHNSGTVTPETARLPEVIGM